MILGRGDDMPPNIWTDVLIHRKCPCCGREDTAIVSKKMKDGVNLPTVICKQCALVYTNPIPEENVYDRFYVEAYNDFYKKNIATLEPKSCPRETGEAINIIEQHVIDNKRPILEIGSGDGCFLYWLQQKYANAAGIEPGPNILRAIEKYGLKAVRGFFESHDFANSKYDALVMVHVFEHFYDVNATLIKCRSILNENGYLFIEVPNIHEPYRSLDKYFLRYVHPINYSEQTIKTMLLKHGFKIVYTKKGASSPIDPRNMFVVAQKIECLEPSIGVAGDYKQTLRILRFYRISWLLYLKQKMLLQTSYFKARRSLRKQLLKTEIGNHLANQIRRIKTARSTS